MEAACLSNLALLEEMLGSAASARRYYEESLVLSEAQRNHPQTLTSLNNLAVLQLAVGEVAAAKALLERGLLLSVTSGSSRMKPLLQSNFGLCLYAEGNPADAEAAYLEAYRELQGRGERATAATVAAYLGQASAAQSRRDEAYGWLSGALKDACELDDAPAQLGVLARLAELIVAEDQVLGRVAAALVAQHPRTDADDRALAQRLAAGAPAGPTLEAVVGALLAPGSEDYRTALEAPRSVLAPPS